MREKRRVDRDHPDYPVYISKCKVLFAIYQKQIDEEMEKYPELHGLDHPAYVVTRKLDRERNAELRKLQKEYSHLFTEEGPEEA